MQFENSLKDQKEKYFLIFGVSKFLQNSNICYIWRRPIYGYIYLCNWGSYLSSDSRVRLVNNTPMQDLKQVYINKVLGICLRKYWLSAELCAILMDGQMKMSGFPFLNVAAVSFIWNISNLFAHLNFFWENEISVKLFSFNIYYNL